MAQYNSNITETQIILTFFDDQFAAVKYEDSLTLPQLADEIRAFSEPNKAKLPWLKLARFGEVRSKNNCLRTNANTLEITGVEIDYDAGYMTFEAAVERLKAARVGAIVYTSASYAKGIKEKWRVLAPLSAATAPSRRLELVAILNGVLGGVAAAESFVLSTAFYYGSVNHNPEHRVEVINGDFIDLRPDLWAGRLYKQGKGKQREAAPAPPGEAPGYDDAEIQALLENSRQRVGDEGQWHNSMLSVTASLVCKGRSNAEIYEITAPYCDDGWGDDDVAELVKSAREKWRRPDPADLTLDLGGPTFLPDWRERYASGFPKASLHNARLAIRHSGLRCSEDLFHNKMLIGRSDAAAPSEPLPLFLGEVTDGAILGLRFWLSDRYGFDLTEPHVRNAVVELARENTFDPVVDMLAEAEASWDGVERLDRMAVEHFNAADTEFNRQCVRKTMIAAVARARAPGCKFDTILTMDSVEGYNKSSSWAVLAGEGNFSDASIIGHAGREVQEQLDGVWIHENPELAGMRKAEVEVVKAFASRQEDRARPAYGHFLVVRPRHSIEVGTTNGDRYLQSQTGNRRFWPIRVLTMIDLAKLRAVRLQLWGEAAHYQSQGESLVLEERLWADAAAEQESRRVQHPWEMLLEDMVVVPAGGPFVDAGPMGFMVLTQVGDELRVHTKTILREVLKIAPGQMNRGHMMSLADAMRLQGWQNKKIKIKGEILSGYVKKVFSGN